MYKKLIYVLIVLLVLSGCSNREPIPQSSGEVFGSLEMYKQPCVDGCYGAKLEYTKENFTLLNFSCYDLCNEILGLTGE